MNVDELLRDALREQAADSASVPSGFADRVLAVRHRRRVRAVVGAAVAAAAVVATAVAVPVLHSGGQDVRPASRMNQSDIIAHPDQSPPRDLIAAGDTALAAFSTYKTVKQPHRDAVMERTYGLLNQKTGKYDRTTRWSWVDVAPGMRTAAVLEKRLPADRIGLLDLITGKVGRWIELDKGVGGVTFSPDGRKLVATTYAKNPDHLYWSHKVIVNGKGRPGPVASRTGFTVVDVASGKSDWHELPFWKDEMGWSPNARADLRFSHDGKLVYEQIPTEPGRIYYDLNGRKVATPAAEKHLSWVEAGLSPDGKLVAGDFAGQGDEIASAIVDPVSGRMITKVPGQQLLAWADDKRLIAWGCDPKKCRGTGEFRNQLLLLTIGSDKVVQLSDFRKASADYPGRWTPQFTTR
ncbi:WD40 repeat domain-containing protein [Streptomyces sp. NPDC055955]|uniref:WD40 repeat domain-containing protein n=1 Tax=Streptomyces sp. NPDC055955 TaxID=3345665 RepID=UPI0035D97A55